MPEAATWMRAMLASDEHRGAALHYAQAFRRVAPLPAYAHYDERRSQLLADPGVDAAVQAVGRTLAFDVYGDNGLQ
jgi:hypothetical protein